MFLAYLGAKDARTTTRRTTLATGLGLAVGAVKPRAQGQSASTTQVVQADPARLPPQCFIHIAKTSVRGATNVVMNLLLANAITETPPVPAVFLAATNAPMTVTLEWEGDLSATDAGR